MACRYNEATGPDAPGRSGEHPRRPPPILLEACRMVGGPLERGDLAEAARALPGGHSPRRKEGRHDQIYRVRVRAFAERLEDDRPVYKQVP